MSYQRTAPASGIIEKIVNPIAENWSVARAGETHPAAVVQLARPSHLHNDLQERQDIASSAETFNLKPAVYAKSSDAMAQLNASVPSGQILQDHCDESWQSS